MKAATARATSVSPSVRGVRRPFPGRRRLRQRRHDAARLLHSDAVAMVDHRLDRGRCRCNDILLLVANAFVGWDADQRRKEVHKFLPVIGGQLAEYKSTQAKNTPWLPGADALSRPRRCSPSPIRPRSSPESTAWRFLVDLDVVRRPQVQAAARQFHRLPVRLLGAEVRLRRRTSISGYHQPSYWYDYSYFEDEGKRRDRRRAEGGRRVGDRRGGSR